MNYVVEMVSRATVYAPSLIMIGSAVQKLTGGIHTDSKVISYTYFYFFKIRNIG
jgi:hypothetical protein